MMLLLKEGASCFKFVSEVKSCYVISGGHHHGGRAGVEGGTDRGGWGAERRTFLEMNK